MKLIAIVNGRRRTLEIFEETNTKASRRFAIDDLPVSADVREIAPGVYSVLLGNRSLEVTLEAAENVYWAALDGRRYEVAVQDPRQRNPHAGELPAAGPLKVICPMPGKIVRVMAKVGDAVQPGAGLLVVEAMKMQNEIKSAKEGVVVAVEVQEGSSVSAGQVLAVVE